MHFNFYYLLQFVTYGSQNIRDIKMKRK